MKKERDDSYLMEQIDKAINELVVERSSWKKAYNYYNGKRDSEQFRYLEENFGLGTPTSLDFTPLIKKHVDAIVGDYLELPILPKVSCKDKETISKITRQKELEINKQVFDFLSKHLSNQALQFFNNGQDIQDAAIENSIKNLIDDINENFISQFEIAAQNVVEYLLQNRKIDIYTKIKTLLIDLLVIGCNFYRVRPTSSNTNIQIEILNPFNTFVEKNPESAYVKDGYRAVIRKWMSKQQILNEYGKDLDAENIKDLENLYETYSDNASLYIRSVEGTIQSRPVESATGLQSNVEAIPGFPYDSDNYYNYKLLPVYQVEWIETDKEDGQYKQNRYEGVRIGQSLYILTGQSQNVIRTKDDPNSCSLSINGVYLVNRDNIPQSLVLLCAPLQDKYDIIQFFRDNILANSGTDGDWLDVSMLPTILGDDLTERIQKWIAFKKMGVALVDTSQEGRAFNNNTSFAGFSDTIKVQTIQAFDLALQRIEDQTSSITGVFRERLNGIQQRDAVSNIEVGAKNSFTITKPFYLTMDNLIVDILHNSLDIAKIVWKNGITGTLILGDKRQKIFTALPEYFTFTDYDVHITSTSTLKKDMLDVKQAVTELIKSNQLSPDIIVDAITSRSLSELKYKVTKAYNKQKQENNQLVQLQQQLQQLQQQNQQLQQQLQQAQTKIETLDEARLELDKQKMQSDTEINWYNARTQRDKSQSDAENDTKRTEIEIAQLYDGLNTNNEVRNL